MIIQDLQAVSALLRVDNIAPAFIYDMQGMENYTADDAGKWFVFVPIIEDRFNFDIFHERRYNLRVLFCYINQHTREMNEDSAYYQAIFDKLSGQQQKFLLNFDVRKYIDGRRKFTVRSEDIKTLYRAQDTLFSVPVTYIEFNLPTTYHSYDAICP